MWGTKIERVETIRTILFYVLILAFNGIYVEEMSTLLELFEHPARICTGCVVNHADSTSSPYNWSVNIIILSRFIHFNGPIYASVSIDDTLDVPDD